MPNATEVDIRKTPKWVEGYKAGLRDRGPTGFPLVQANMPILLGAYVMMGARIPIHRIYMHPFTLAHILSLDQLGLDQLTSEPKLYPLTEEMEKALQNFEQTSGIRLR